MKKYDLIVLGGGPGGYTAAIHAAQAGANVCLVEKDFLGGTCTNRGCIPTKALAASAHLLKQTRNAAVMGINPGTEVVLDYPKVIERKNQVVEGLREGIRKLLLANKIEIVQGRGRLAGPGRISLDQSDQELTGKSIILATGSQPTALPSMPLSEPYVVTSDQLLEQDDPPSHLVIVGGGVIGCEFASIFHTFGVKVTVIELLDRLLPTMDPSLSSWLTRAFKKAGIQFMTKTAVQGLDVTDEGVVVVLPDGKSIECDRVLVSVGRRSVTSDLGLDQAGIKLQKGSIVTDERMASSLPGVYAVGDAVGMTWLAHTAAKEAEIAASNVLGKDRTMRYWVIPSVVFTDPELACVGLMPSEADDQGIPIRKGRFYYAASGKAQCDGATDGLVEIVTEAGSETILGGWVAGQGAGTLIAEIAVAIRQGLTAYELSEVIHAHPTLPEMIVEAAADSLGKAIHKAPPRRRSS
jgi:dihydrolipoamide dehydrogenase